MHRARHAPPIWPLEHVVAADIVVLDLVIVHVAVHAEERVVHLDWWVAVASAAAAAAVVVWRVRGEVGWGRWDGGAKRRSLPS